MCVCVCVLVPHFRFGRRTLKCVLLAVITLRYNEKVTGKFIPTENLLQSSHPLSSVCHPPSSILRHACESNPLLWNPGAARIHHASPSLLSCHPLSPTVLRLGTPGRTNELLSLCLSLQWLFFSSGTTLVSSWDWHWWASDGVGVDGDN